MLAPSFANSIAVSLPIPDDAPVIRINEDKVVSM